MTAAVNSIVNFDKETENIYVSRKENPHAVSVLNTLELRMISGEDFGERSSDYSSPLALTSPRRVGLRHTDDLRRLFSWHTRITVQQAGGSSQSSCLQVIDKPVEHFGI